MSNSKDICVIKTKKAKANSFISYFSAFLTVALVVCLIVSIITFFDFAGHFWRGGLFLCIVLLFIFSQVLQWEIDPVLEVDEKGKIVYKYKESVNALGHNEVAYTFERVDKIKYKTDLIVIKGLFKYKAPLRKVKEVKTCKIRYSDENIEKFLTKHFPDIKE